LPKCAQLVSMGVCVCSERGWEGEGFVPFQQSVRWAWGMLLFTPSLFQVLWALVGEGTLPLHLWQLGQDSGTGLAFGPIW